MSKRLKFCYFVTIFCIALSLGPALAHLYEFPAKITFEGEFWLELLHRLYPPAFGTAGAFFEVASIVAVVVLAYLARYRGSVFLWIALGVLCLAASHAAFWIWVAPVNATLAPLTADTLPSNWSALRDQWEYAHAARAVLQLLGMSAIVMALIVETPGRALRKEEPQSRSPS